MEVLENKKVKLSDFLQERHIESYKDDDDNIKYRIVSPKINMEGIHFYNLSLDVLDDISKKLNNDINDNIIEDSKSIYNIFEYLTDIEKDVTVDQFKSMFLLPPNDEFAFIREQLYKEMIDIIKKMQSSSDLAKNVNKEMKDSIEQLPEPVKKVISKQEELSKVIPKQNKINKLKEKLEVVKEDMDKEKDARKAHDLLIKRANLEKEIFDLEDEIKNYLDELLKDNDQTLDNKEDKK